MYLFSMTFRADDISVSTRPYYSSGRQAAAFAMSGEKGGGLYGSSGLFIHI